MKLIHNEQLKKVVRIIKNIIFGILVIFILLVCLQRFSNNKIALFNYRMFTVITGSMEPKYKVGDILVSKKIDPGKIKKGQTVSYLGKRNLNGMVITHEVIDINKDQEGKYIFTTKGLANPVADIDPVSEDQLYGVIIYKTFFLSAIYKIVGTKVGMLIFIFVPIAYIVGSEIIHSLLDKEEDRRNNLKKKNR